MPEAVNEESMLDKACRDGGSIGWQPVACLGANVKLSEHDQINAMSVQSFGAS
jgi:hypothetical protein